jgi:adenine-specific DNA-methyltransferase
MKLLPHPPSKALNKAYLRHSLRRDQIDLFKSGLARMFERIRTDESEEHLKNIVADFLKDTWYKQTNEINTKDRKDLVIHNGKFSADTVAVIIEAKKPSNKTEMISAERPNAKALHELILYYLREAVDSGNHDIKYLIATNIHEWFVFDGVWFEKNIFRNSKLIKEYQAWKVSGHDTRHFYERIAQRCLDGLEDDIPCTYFDFRDVEKIIRTPPVSPPKLGGDERGGDDRKLIELYKVLSPPHLLKQSFANDANSLNREFYNELLHIIGLEEVNEKGKKLISRKAPDRRNEGSLLENAINMLNTQRALDELDNPEQFGSSDDERLFSIGLELCIIWLNRILFLKLLEGQLISYHRGDRGYAFLKSDKITDFDDLQELFFEVLARRLNERSPSVAAKFGAIPYLNSSLFEISDLERKTIQISNLKGRLEMPVHGATVLKDANGKRISGNRSTLGYLFDFLDAYDFASEGKADILETAKTIINASVLGLIFEKINGYRDGSFYTPGFITMYMSREAIRRAVVQKFRDAKLPGCQNLADFDDLCDKLDYTDKELRQKANDIANSLRICDPAVGSGHFLVSALNEIIAVKSDLHILTDRDGKRLHGCVVTIENDELIITVEDELFVYNPKDPESRRIQEALFHEKQAIIEQCLFGVDINPKSVAICRLRLWIELLKSAYYTRESGYAELETLPNIDINIKCGNSLISRFALRNGGNQQLSQVELNKRQQLTKRYKEKVWQYKLAPANKAILRKEIAALKEDLQNFAVPVDKDLMALRKLKNDLDQTGFGFVKEDMEQYHALLAREEELKRVVAEKLRTMYGNAFEWRFEFPEVLDEEGNFTGFDVVIGNPPYIRQEAIKEQKQAIAALFGSFFCGTADIYTYFYKTGLEVLKPGGLLSFIAPNKFMRAGYGKNTRELLTTQAKPLMVLDFGDLPIFDEATTYPSIVMVEKNPPSQPPPAGGRSKKVSLPKRGRVGEGENFLAATFTYSEQLTRFDESLATIGFTMPVSALKSEGWNLERPEVLALMAKLRKAGKPLSEYVENQIFYGIKTGLNEAFVIDEKTKARLIAEDPKSAEIIKPWLRGRDIWKWKAQWAGLYVLFTRRGTDIEQFPGIKRHLEQFKADLEPKTSESDKQGRKPGTYKWFEIQDNIAYFKEFEKEKILWPGITSEIVFGLGDKGQFGNDNNQLIISSDRCLIAILNSRLIRFVLQQICDKVRGGFYRMKMIYVEQLPIPTASAAQKAPIIERVEQILANPDSPAIPALEAEIDRLVYALYGLTDEEIAVVEGKNLKGEKS